MPKKTIDEPILNRLLGALPREEYERLRPRLEPVSLPQRKIVYGASATISDVYFLKSGTASLVIADNSGSSVAVAIVGKEGILGFPAIFGMTTTMSEVVMQTSGIGMKMRATLASDLLARRGAFAEQLFRYIPALFAQIAQTAFCNRFHTLEHRISRWLLVTADLDGRLDRFEVTQDFLSYLLGAGRPAINSAVNSLKKKGTIRTFRGSITIASHRELECASCECWRLIKAGYDTEFKSQD